MDVAGIYITEYQVDCIIGEWVAETANERTVGKIKKPSTEGRIEKTFKRDGRDPAELLKICANWIAEESNDLKSVVISCFGPFQSLDTSKLDSGIYSEYGALANVEEYPGWGRLHIYHIFKSSFKEAKISPLVRVCTDVDAAAFGEFWYRLNNGGDVSEDSSLVYLNFSRSISGGIVHRGEVWKGQLHPFMNIICSPKFSFVDNEGEEHFDKYEGSCPYHDGCIEGAVGVTALEERTQKNLEDIDIDDPVWEIFAFYAANLCIAVSGVLAPSRIVLGGRIIQEQVNRRIANRLLKMIRGYFYDYVVSIEKDGAISPSYGKIAERTKYISLPDRPKTKDGKVRMSKPGRHGALGMASRNLYGLLNEHEPPSKGF